MKDLLDMKNKFKGFDIWILGAGPSMSYIDMDFFKNKIVFAINNMFKKIKATFTFVTNNVFIESALSDKNIVIAPEYEMANEAYPLNKFISDDLIIFKHVKRKNRELKINGEFFSECLEAIGKDNNIFVGCGTVASAMHACAYMGAKNIILCGNDCGWIDGMDYVKDYGMILPDSIDKTTKKFERFNRGGEIVKAKLKEIYNCNIYSLNPFINFRLEGHQYATAK